LSFTKVDSESVFIGESKGGWIYSSQRPRHEVQCPSFFIMEHPLTNEQLSDFSKGLDLDQDSTCWSQDKLDVVEHELSKRLLEKKELLDSKFDWEIRCPSQGEWYLSGQQNKISTKIKSRELLSDCTSSNNRGAMMDGRPRKFEGFGPMTSHKAIIEIHPSKINITALSSIPMDRENRSVMVRFVIVPIRKGPVIRVPQNADLFSNIRVELFWTIVLGIIPSFAIPIFRGMGSYAVSGWANLLFGGLCAGFVSGAFWRPKRPTIMYDDGEVIQLSPE
jgi:hypothetical protein